MAADASFRPHIVGIGGTTKAGSTSERALAAALAACEQKGARTTLIGGATLKQLPMYFPEESARSTSQHEFLASVRSADGIILSTPAYHAGISGLLKNAIDLLEDLRSDTRPYLTDLPVGCIVCAYGWQGGGVTLASIRTIVHALRGWPTPLGVTLNSSMRIFDDNGAFMEPQLAGQFRLLADQVVTFAEKYRK